MKNAWRCIRLVLTIAIALTLTPWSSSGQSNGVIESGYRQWIGSDSVDHLFIAEAQITVHDSEVIAIDYHADRVAVGIETFPDATIISQQVHDVPGYMETVTSFQGASIQDRAILGVQLDAQLRNQTVSTRLYTIIPMGTDAEESLFVELYETVATMASGIFLTEPSLVTPSQSPAGWVGGIMDQFPSSVAHPYIEATLSAVSDDYSTGSITVLPAAVMEPETNQTTLIDPIPDPAPEIDTEEKPDAEAAPNVSAETSVAAAPNGVSWIAYNRAWIGEQGVTLVRADGSESHRVTLMSADDITWSHDGSMLSFSVYGTGSEDDGIWLIRDGEVARFEGTAGCTNPGFLPSNARIVFVCASPANSAQPKESFIPQSIVGAPANALYFPALAHFSTLETIGLDGTDRQVEYTLTPDDIASQFGNSPFSIMVHQLRVSPDDGRLLVTFADAAAPATTSGGVVFSDSFGIIQPILLDENGLEPMMLPDGTIVTRETCGAGTCSNGYQTQAFNLDGSSVNLPILEDSAGTNWTWEITPDYSARLIWNYDNGIGLTGNDAPIFMVVESSGVTSSQPRYQPAPVQITIPDPMANVSVLPSSVAAPETPIGDDAEVEIGVYQNPALGNGWIAYGSIGGPDTMPGVTLIQPDGTSQVKISELNPMSLAWSHDGTMLAIGGASHPIFQSDNGIWLLRNGVISKIPDSENCFAPAFTADNLRLIYGCMTNDQYEAQSSAMLPNSDAVISIGTPFLDTIRSSNINGTDQRIEYQLTSEDKAAHWTSPLGEIVVFSIDVDRNTGSLLITFSDSQDPNAIPRAVVTNHDFEFVSSHQFDAANSIFPIMLPDGTIVVGTLLALQTLDGAPLPSEVSATWPVPDAWTSVLAPDGQSSVAFGGQLGLWIRYPDGSTFQLDRVHSGIQPSWQPVDAPLSVPDSVHRPPR